MSTWWMLAANRTRCVRRQAEAFARVIVSKELLLKLEKNRLAKQPN